MEHLTPALPPLFKGELELDALRADPLRFLTEQAQELGDIFRYESSGWATVVLNRPDYIKQVLQANSENYTKVGTPDLMMLRPMLGDGLMTSEGADWEEQRKMLRPTFDNQQVDALVEVMADAAGALIERWEACADAGEVIDVEGDLSFLTLRIVTRCLFGADLTGETANFGAAVQVQNECMAHFDPTDRKRLLEFQEASETIERIVRGIIAHRHAEPHRGGDLLSVLMTARWADGTPLSDRQIRDQIFTFLMAGHETTSKALSWSFYLLDQNPDAIERVRAEARDVLRGRAPEARDMPNLTYTWMVLQEAMRLYPPVWLMSRVAILDDEFGEYRVPSGSLVVVSPYIMHRHPAYFPEPLRFDPERFLPQRADERDPYCYFPFSGGPRICIGRRFAMLETRIVLAMVVSRLRLMLVPGHPVEPEALVTLRPRHGLRMTARRVGV